MKQVQILDRKTGQISRVDPNKLNRGQVIHFDSTKPLLNNCVSNRYEVKKDVNLNNTKNTIVLDWFSTTIYLPKCINSDTSKLELSDGIWLENTNIGSQFYLDRFNLYYQGELFGTLELNPRNQKLFDKHQGQFKIENRLLYTKDWLDSYKDIYNNCNWTHRSLTRTDIAIDGEAGQRGFDYSIKGITGRTIKRKGKTRIGLDDIDGQGDAHKIKIGSLKSDKYGKIYCKTDELEQSNKQYISQFWESSGLNNTDKVWRYEISLRSGIGNNYDWQRLDDLDYLASIVKTETKNWFEFYYMGKDKNKHRVYKNASIEIIDWESIKAELLPKTKATDPSQIHKVKTLVKNTLYFNYIGKTSIDTTHILELVGEYSLHKWLDVRIDFWHDEWDKEMKRYKDDYLSN